MLHSKTNSLKKDLKKKEHSPQKFSETKGVL